MRIWWSGMWIWSEKVLSHLFVGAPLKDSESADLIGIEPVDAFHIERICTSNRGVDNRVRARLYSMIAREVCPGRMAAVAD
jgi:hypothetical protein